MCIIRDEGISTKNLRPSLQNLLDQEIIKISKEPILKNEAGGEGDEKRDEATELWEGG